jgi:hypothetical protein
MRRRDYDYTPRPRGGYRKPNLEGLFDDKAPPLVIRRRPSPGPAIGTRRKPWRPAEEAIAGDIDAEQRGG